MTDEHLSLPQADGDSRGVEITDEQLEAIDYQYGETDAEEADEA